MIPRSDFINYTPYQADMLKFLQRSLELDPIDRRATHIASTVDQTIVNLPRLVIASFQTRPATPTDDRDPDEAVLE